MIESQEVAVLINGRAATAVDVHDRGLHYGDGLFETVAVIDGRPQLWEQHLDRLEAGCARLGIGTDWRAKLDEETRRWCADRGHAVLKVLVTRGAGGRGYRPPPAAGTPTRLVICYPHAGYSPDPYRDGVALRVCDTRLGLNPSLAGLKHLNRLEQVMARREWDDPAIAEGLMLDTGGNVVEGTMTNLFVVAGDELVTPAVSQCGVAGVMRGHVLGLARRHMSVSEQTLPLAAVGEADEVFVCNSLIGIWPVRRLGTVSYRIGPVTRQLMEEVRGCCLMPGR